MKKKVLSVLIILSMLCVPVFALANTLPTEDSQNTGVNTGTYKPFKSTVMEAEQKKDNETLSRIPSENAYIPADTILNIELTEAISSKKIKKGDPIPLKTLDNIIINDIIVIPAGTPVEGVVTKATKSGLFGRSGKLEFTINSVKTINNVIIPLQYTAMKEAGSDGGAIAVAAVVSIVGGLFMKGKNVEFAAGTHFQAKVTADTDLHVTLKDLPDAMNPNKPHGVSITLK
jgi:ribosomal protein L2